MRNTFLAGWLMFAFSIHWLMAQLPKLPGEYERYRQKMVEAFNRGDYQMAGNIARFCLRNYRLSESTELDLLREIRRGVDIQELKNKADLKVRTGDLAGAKAIYRNILTPAYNPADPVIKNKLQQLDAPAPNLEWVRWERAADKFIADKDFNRANEILRIIPPQKRSPTVVSKLEMTRDLPAKIAHRDQLIREANIAEAKRIDKELRVKYGPDVVRADPFEQYDNYLKRRAEADRYLFRCRYDLAEREYRQIRQTYPEYSRQLTRRIEQIQRFSSTQRNVNDWESDPSKQEAVLQAYSYLYRHSSHCVAADYYNYIFRKGIVQLQNEKFEAALISFNRASYIKVAYAKRISAIVLRDSCQRMLSCLQRNNVYKTQLAEVERLYNNNKCQGDSAVRLYQRIRSTACPQPSVETDKIWQDRLLALKTNQADVDRFNSLVASAQQLLSEERCAEAKRLYNQADSIKIDCRVLDKKNIRLADCEACIQRQQCDSLLQKAELSLKINRRYNALALFKQYRNICDPAGQLVGLSQRIADLECQIQGKNCPEVQDNIVRSLIKPSIVLGSTYTIPSLSTNGQLLRSDGGWSGALGMRVERLSFKNWLDLRTELNYARYVFYTLTPNHDLINQRFQIDIADIGFGLKIHTPSRSQRKSQFGKLRLYLHGGTAWGWGIRYRYQNFSLDTKDNDIHTLNSSYNLLKGGIGAEIHQKKFGVSIEGVYQSNRRELFNLEPNRNSSNPYFLSSPTLTTIGLRLSLRWW
ncbi:hypothetical protein [Spirosoma sp.]|uniref:hypothetical protein n=1 Tax=Spirosoma sp. TaxID=1899569 RepID=UPI003B3A89EE